MDTDVFSITAEKFLQVINDLIDSEEKRIDSKPSMSENDENKLIMLSGARAFAKGSFAKQQTVKQTKSAPDNELILGWIRFRKEEIIPSDKHDRYGIQLGKLSDPVRAQLLLLFGLEDLLRKPENY